MVEDLDNACYESRDPPEYPSLVAVQRVSTGRAGRPRLEIDHTILQHGLETRGTHSLAKALGCSARTVRRRALAAGLATPAPPVYTDTVAADGSMTRTYTSSTRPVSVFTDEQLDTAIASIFQVFPSFGRSLLRGHLRASGHNVPLARIREAVVRIQGTPGIFAGRAVHRKVYSVAGANSLWHHDGQHGMFRHLCESLSLSGLVGLIRFKIVMHCFIDGKSRLVTGIRASNNNRAATVLELFLEAMDEWGVPSRVRGDHGTENLLVAAWIEEARGVGRGSYIWGR